MNYLVLHRSDGYHIQGRERKIIGHLVAESTLKTAVRVRHQLLGLAVRVLLGEIEPPSAAKILDIDEILHKPLNNPVCIGTAAE
jgi:hypothetical protein